MLNDKQQNFLKNWLTQFKVIDENEEFLIKPVGETGNIPVIERKDKSETNIADLGFGVSQLVAMLLKIIFLSSDSTNNDNVLYIEEPEANLHPNFQSLMADMIVDAYKKFGIRFILETHSEYLIRKLQYLTAKKKIKTTDTIIYYLSKERNETTTKAINIFYRVPKLTCWIP